MISKAELHVHLEGTMAPSLVTKIAKRNGIDIPSEIFAPDDTFVWDDFLDFLKVYDKASFVLRTEEDYYDMTYDYLRRTAKEGGIYVETMYSPDHADLCGVPYEKSLQGMIRAIDDARRDFAIECRLIATCVRHFGVQKCEAVANRVIQNLHPYITGFGMGGDEAGFPPKQFAKAFDIAFSAGLSCTNHAGEMVGPQSVWDSIEYLPVKRIGHGVRSIEDNKLLETLVERDITLEVCPGSNIALNVYPSFDAHPFLALREAGVRVTLSSDDPPYFATTLGREYLIAHKIFGLDDKALKEITRNSLVAAFVDEETRQKLLARV